MELMSDGGWKTQNKYSHIVPIIKKILPVCLLILDSAQIFWTTLQKKKKQQESGDNVLFTKTDAKKVV